MTSGTEHVEITVADGLRFHVASAGTGPPVVLLHGFTGSTETWTELQATLSDRFRTIAVDITGHGRSAAPTDPERYSLVRFADDLRDILDGLAIPRAALLGYSMGGRAALRFVLRYPDRVAGLILESTSPGISDPVERDHRIAADLALAQSVERDGVTAFMDRWEQLPLWDSLAAAPESLRHRLRAQRLTNRATGLANSLRGAGAAADPPVVDDLSTIRTLVRIIAGVLDARYVRLGQLMAAAIPHADLNLIDGAGHMAHLERPEQFAELAGSFLDSLDTRDGDWL
ncbi:MAG: 2-succinyl-6-hydroxy-2,4-cyclohexadiene-1-carboxylate synthase [Gemmatimonadales bacterium]